MKKFYILLFISSIIFSTLLTAADWTNYTTANSGILDNTVSSVFVDEFGIKWIGTEKGLCSLNGTTWKNYAADKGISFNIRDIVPEISNYGPEIWMASDSGAIVATTPIDGITSATRYTPGKMPIASANVNTVAVDENHVKWFGTAANGVSALFNGVWEQMTTQNHLSNNKISKIAADKNGNKYIATLGGGVSRVKWNGVDAVTSASPYDYDWSGLLSRKDIIYTVYVLENGDQWYGTDTGCAFHDTTETKEGWYAYTEEDGLGENHVLAITQDKQGNMWFGTQGGVSKFKNNVFVNYTTADGLADSVVNDIAVDLDGSLWFATANGLSHFTGGTTSVNNNTEPKQAFTYNLVSNYPNPFNPETMITYTVPVAGHVQVEIYNMNGQIVQTLVNSKHSAGNYSVLWNGQNYNNVQANTGVYFARLTVSGQSSLVMDSHKILLLK